MSENQTKARIGVDIGGTFTDVVLEHGDELYTLKLLTQLEAPENGVREGVSRVLAVSYTHLTLPTKRIV